ncbi:hypothetical protein MRB53_009104 [Persea americana]|uniref:Uncharacterized protein n=1 Tax=Persea americana TaxID=3435 RepID=A0ACC2LN61_PERAE|nr:hypothetical protein MRB53_009104 [Persea americana]
MDSQISWDSLRKQARKLEAQLDEQMSFCRRLVAAKADGSENDLESGGLEIFSHTLTRHQEVLHDLTQAFHRLRSRQALLKEQAAVSRSTGQMDTVISQAQATLGALVLQRLTFSAISSKITNISSRLPSV